MFMCKVKKIYDAKKKLSQNFKNFQHIISNVHAAGCSTLVATWLTVNLTVNLMTSHNQISLLAAVFTMTALHKG